VSKRLTKVEVEQIAALAHLELTTDETELFTRQLGAILEYAERLQEVDTDDITSTWNPSDIQSPLRRDDVRASLPSEDALSNAPDATVRGPAFFRVPKVIG